MANVKVLVESDGMKYCIVMKSDQDTINLDQLKEYLANHTLTLDIDTQTQLPFEIYDEDFKEWVLIDEEYGIRNLAKLRTVTLTNNELRSGKQYLLLNGQGGQVIILDGETLAEVCQKNLPETRLSSLAVCDGLFYVINTEIGEIHCTTAANLLTDETVTWEKCCSFKSDYFARGTAAVIGHIVYFMNRTRLLSFNTKTKIVTQLHVVDGPSLESYSLVEVNGRIYCCRGKGLQVTNGANEWTVVDTSIAYPNYGSLIKMRNSVCVVGGYERGVDSRSVLCYDTRGRFWSTMDTLKDGRSCAATVALDGRGILVVGGWTSGWTNSTQLLDEVSCKWISMPNLVIPHKLGYPLVVTFYVQKQ